MRHCDDDDDYGTASWTINHLLTCVAANNDHHPQTTVAANLLAVMVNVSSNTGERDSND